MKFTAARTSLLGVDHATASQTRMTGHIVELNGLGIAFGHGGSKHELQWQKGSS